MDQFTTFAPRPWHPSFHNQIADANNRSLLEVYDYWIGEENDDAIHDDDKTRAIAAYVLTAINNHDALYQALYDVVNGKLNKGTWDQARAALAAVNGEQT